MSAKKASQPTEKASFASMDEAAIEAKKEFAALMSNPKASAADLIAFHQKWFMVAGHTRLGQIYRDHGKE